MSRWFFGQHARSVLPTPALASQCDSCVGHRHCSLPDQIAANLCMMHTPRQRTHSNSDDAPLLYDVSCGARSAAGMADHNRADAHSRNKARSVVRVCACALKGDDPIVQLRRRCCIRCRMCICSNVKGECPPTSPRPSPRSASAPAPGVRHPSPTSSDTRQLQVEGSLTVVAT